MLTEEKIQAIKPVRYERKVTDGQGLYLLVTPKGALHTKVSAVQTNTDDRVTLPPKLLESLAAASSPPAVFPSALGGAFMSRRIVAGLSRKPVAVVVEAHGSSVAVVLFKGR